MTVQDLKVAVAKCGSSDYVKQEKLFRLDFLEMTS